MASQEAASKPRWLGVLGPGLITGASDDDPSGIATYSQAGAQFGFAIGWTMIFSYPLMCVIQEISARIGRTTGRGTGTSERCDNLGLQGGECHRLFPTYPHGRFNPETSAGSSPIQLLSGVSLARSHRPAQPNSAGRPAVNQWMIVPSPQ
jgi:hypothetical protein